MLFVRKNLNLCEFLFFKRIYWIGVSIIVFIRVFVFAQNEAGVIHINSKDGLPTNAVNCIFKDSYGYYWIGTQSGVCRYDGYKIENLFNNKKKDTLFLNCSNIFVIKQYRHYIIFGCDNGIKFYDVIKNRLLKWSDTINIGTVYDIWVSGDKLYIASQNGFYEFSFKEQRLRKYSINKDSSKNYTFNSDTKIKLFRKWFFIVDPNLYIRPIDTINHSIKDSVLGVKIKNARPTDMVAYANSLYVSYSKYGIIRFDANTLEKIDEPVLLKNYTNIEEINSLTVLKNKIYISSKKGVFEYNPLNQSVTPLELDEKNNDLYLTHLYAIDNNLITVSNINGIFLVPLSIKKINNPIPKEINNLFSNCFALYEYVSGKIMIAGQSKFFLYDFLNQKIEGNLHSIFSNYFVLFIQPSHDRDKFYLATYGSYILLFDLRKKTIKPITNTINPDASDYVSLYMDDNDTLWCGSIMEGLYKYNIKTNKWLQVKGFEGLTINYIRKKENYYWIGTSEKGLYQIDTKGKIIKVFNTENKLLSDNTVYSIELDSNYLYIATENGLTVYDRKQNTSQYYYETDGLMNSNILSVMKDNTGKIWIGTMKGISKMLPENLNNHNKRLFYNYSLLDGLINYEYCQNAYLKLKNGYLLYAGTNGLDIISPLKLRSTFNKIPIYVTSFKKNGKEYFFDTVTYLKRYFEVDWRQNNIQLEITAINPLLSEKVLYKYKLVGYDDDYSEPTNIRYISYTGLPGGTYKLQILSTNPDGEWSTEPYYIYIKVIPPFWKTPWFIITSSIFLFGSIFGFNQYRTYQVKKRNKELEQKVKERTKELADKNHEILSSIEYAKRIQQAILPIDKYVQQVLPNAFILYKPKDIVSGDFYWVYEVTPKDNSQKKSVIVAVVDCTGHGVPGALMSMIGNNLLNQIVIEKNITAPDQILKEMNKGVQNALKQGQSDAPTNDGMDASLLHYFPVEGKIQWAGAYRPLLIIRVNGQIEKIEGDKYPIGGVQQDTERHYSLHTLSLQKGDTIYLFSDGYADQFGGEKGKKMMLKRLFNILSQIHLKPTQEQKNILENYFEQWKGNGDQTDDVLVIGIVHN